MKTLTIFSFVFGLLFLNVRCEWCLEDQICVELNDLVIRFITSSDPEDCLELCQTYQSEKCEFWTWHANLNLCSLLRQCLDVVPCPGLGECFSGSSFCQFRNTTVQKKPLV